MFARLLSCWLKTNRSWIVFRTKLLLRRNKMKRRRPLQGLKVVKVILKTIMKMMRERIRKAS